MKNTKAYRLSFTTEAKAIVSRMTLDEKIRLMAGDETVRSSMGGGSYNLRPYTAGGNVRLGVPKLRFCDGPRGCVSGASTCFPVTVGRGATFDPDLEERVGRAIGREIRANGGNFFGGVCLNVPYNPGAGRSQEVYGEDAHHIAKMGAALIRGVQEENVIACIKHFAFNSMENARFYVNVTCDKRAEREVFLYQFKKCVEAGAGAVMSAYNRYNGHFCGSNPYLLRQVLKKEWDFDGFVISDFFFGTHSTERCLNAGLDVEMHMRRHYSPALIKAALRLGRVKLRDIDEAAVRIVRTLLAFSQSPDDIQYTPDLIACKAHIALAREVADKSITLVKNDGLLPLDPEVCRRVAVVGDLADEENIGDHGSSMVRPPYVRTLTSAIEENYPEIKFDFVPTAKARDFASVIKNADAVILAVGCRHSDEGEFIFTIGGDRKDLGLREEDLALVQLVSYLNDRVAVVLTGGNAIRVHEWKNRVGAILFAYYPGMEGGAALADILFGRVNPSGKLPFAVAEDDRDYPQLNWTAKDVRYSGVYGYRKLDLEKKDVDFPFGFGLSYTRFALSGARLVSADEKSAVFGVTVTNTGERAGDEVVQLYTAFPESRVTRPVRMLTDFARVSLQPGESREVTLTAEKADLAYFDAEKNAFVEENTLYAAQIGTDERSAGAMEIRYRFGEEER